MSASYNDHLRVGVNKSSPPSLLTEDRDPPTVLFPHYSEPIMVKRKPETPKKSPTKPEDSVIESPREHCPICMDTITTAGVIGCGHEFCFDCIHRWSNTENSCPLCKKRFRAINRKEPSDSNTPSAKKAKRKGGTKVNVRHRNQAQQAGAMGGGGIFPFHDFNMLRMMFLRNILEDDDPFDNAAFYMPLMQPQPQAPAPPRSVRVSALMRMGGEGIRRGPAPRLHPEVIVLDDSDQTARRSNLLYLVLLFLRFI